LFGAEMAIYVARDEMQAKMVEKRVLQSIAPGEWSDDMQANLMKLFNLYRDIKLQWQGVALLRLERLLEPPPEVDVWQDYGGGEG
jgi:hypothetical protein